MKRSRRFAEGTDVPVDRSQEQIKKLVTAAGATGYLQAEGMQHDGQFRALIQFRLHERMLRYTRIYPSLEETPRGRSTEQVRAWREAEWRRRWRALHLIIKAKLELVASGDVSFEREFLSDIMLPDGSTVGDNALPALAESYSTGGMPKLLPGGG